MEIREAHDSDLTEVLNINRQAFGPDEGPVIVGLIQDILSDPTAKPLLSLIAVEEDQILGHIVFSAARLSVAQSDISVALLAPLAVLPVFQSRGIGGALIADGLRRLAEAGVDLVFVLGHPNYYNRHGFAPAGREGFDAPYPIAPENADAWMVQALRPDAVEANAGTVQCCAALDKPEYWQE